MVKIILITIVFGFIFVILLYESFQSIRKHDDSMAVICAIGGRTDWFVFWFTFRKFTFLTSTSLA